MVRISNLCKLVLLSVLLTFCAPAHAQQTEMNMKVIRTICSSIPSFLDYADSEGYRIYFMGQTATPGVQDVIFMKGQYKEFMAMRFIESTQEACMLSIGVPTFFEN